MELSEGQTTRERRRERTKAIILHAAEELLAEGGLQELTLANIAHRAAYSKPAIYEYFHGIEDILLELTNAGFIRLGEVVKAIPAALPPDERILVTSEAILQFANENSDLFELMFTYIIFKHKGPDGSWQESRTDTEVAYQEVFEIIQEGIDQGIFKTRPGFDASMMMYMCWIVVHGMASLKHGLVQEMGLNEQRYHAEMLRLMINNLKGILPEDTPGTSIP